MVDMAQLADEQIEGAQHTYAEMSEEIDRLRAFACDIMEVWPHSGLDGGELQDIAVKHGLLIPETRIESCGENCACVEYGFPTDCHRRIEWLLTPNVPVEGPPGGGPDQTCRVSPGAYYGEQK